MSEQHSSFNNNDGMIHIVKQSEWDRRKKQQQIITSYQSSSGLNIKGQSK